MRQKKIKLNIVRIMAMFLCALMFVVNAPIVHAEEGTCGKTLEWSFDGSTLTITGTGSMTNYSAENLPPWYEFRQQILHVSLPDGLTRIGDLAFYECVNLSSVSLPASVELIGESAFFRNSSMTMLTLNEGLRSIGRKAFAECSALADLRLPSTMSLIENYAFSMCNSLSYVTIPAYVQEFGSGVFSYCKNLIRVDVESAVALPGWSFYGCDKLQTVTVLGNSVEPESLMESNYPGEVSIENLPDHAGSDVDQATKVDVVEKNYVSKSDDATTVTTTQSATGKQGSTSTSITATIYNDNGWKDVIAKVNSATIGGNSSTLNVTVYIPGGDVVSSDALQKFAGKNVALTIQTQSGSQYTLDCTQLEDKLKDNLNLNYTLVPMDEVPEELKGCTVYRLNFYASAKLPAELVIRLPGGHALSTATLYQVKGTGKLERLQSVVVDPYGDAHWYVSAVDEKTEYLIGIDVPGIEEESPIIPPALHNMYKVENVYDGVEYVITGRSSSWGMNLGQVMGIMVAVMVGVIAIVGVVVYGWNKRRVRSGYVPGWDDMEDEDDDD